MGPAPPSPLYAGLCSEAGPYEGIWLNSGQTLMQECPATGSTGLHLRPERTRRMSRGGGASQWSRSLDTPASASVHSEHKGDGGSGPAAPDRGLLMRFVASAVWGTSTSWETSSSAIAKAADTFLQRNQPSASSQTRWPCSGMRARRHGSTTPLRRLVAALTPCPPRQQPLPLPPLPLH